MKLGGAFSKSLGFEFRRAAALNQSDHFVSLLPTPIQTFFYLSRTRGTIEETVDKDLRIAIKKSSRPLKGRSRRRLRTRSRRHSETTLRQPLKGPLRRRLGRRSENGERGRCRCPCLKKTSGPSPGSRRAGQARQADRTPFDRNTPRRIDMASAV